MNINGASLASLCLMPNARLLGMLLVFLGCGGPAATGGTQDGATPDGSGASGPIFQNVYLKVSGVSDMQCLDAALPVADSGLPNCVVVSARTVSTPEEAAACKRCDEPGLGPFVSPVPLDRIGEGLSDYPCLCAVTPLPTDAGCWPIPQPSSAFWCYAYDQNPIASPPCGDATGFGSHGPILGFSPGMADGGVGVVYVACFEPQATE